MGVEEKIIFVLPQFWLACNLTPVSFTLTSARRLRKFIPRLMFTGNVITISLVKNDMKQYELVDLNKGKIMK